MRAKSLLTIRYLIQFQSNWLIHGPSQESDAATGFMTDFSGRPYLPGSTMKGKVRDGFNRLITLRPDWKKYQSFLFGNSGMNAGQVYFYDGVMEGDHEELVRSEVRTRVALDRYRRTVKDRAVITEKVVRPIRVHGTIETYVLDSDKEHVALILLSCLLETHTIGSGASIGRGRLEMLYGTPNGEQGRTTDGKSFCWVEELREGQLTMWSYERFAELVGRMERKEG